MWLVRESVQNLWLEPDEMMWLALRPSLIRMGKFHVTDISEKKVRSESRGISSPVKGRQTSISNQTISLVNSASLAKPNQIRPGSAFVSPFLHIPISLRRYNYAVVIDDGCVAVNISVTICWWRLLYVYQRVFLKFLFHFDPLPDPTSVVQSQ